MTRDEWQRIKDVAMQAWERPAGDRESFIASACGGDETLRREVESLVRSAVEAESMYEQATLSVPGGVEAVVSLALGPAVVGTRVDAYRIVREIGHGGMGRVYLAERADGEFDQQVAIKFVGAGLFSDALRDRFREERRILAALDHPNIARLIDGGTTPDGQPYVVMEYVSGAAIDEFCTARALPVRARVELFRTVCGAVHHAHQRLVIHRDIKASNILVTADGTPKLLDFGIATLFDPSVPASERGRTVLRALTPESASPEQLRGEPITLAADVYALGNLLYGLLTGRLPYGDTTQSEAELARTICEEPPQPPSVAARRAGRSDVIDADLDRIVLQALRKEPERRYSSADALSEDLRRWLEGFPVLAGPDSAGYRTQKFIRRHRAGVAASAAALAAVLAGTVIAVQQAGVARRERATAERRFDQVRQLAGSFLFELHDAIAELPGALRARQLVVRRAAEYLDGLSREAQDDAALQRELALAYQRLGEIEGGAGVSSLGDLAGAERHYGRALALREALVARPDASAADRDGLSELRVLLSRMMLATGRLDAAEENAAQAVAVLPASDSDDAHLAARAVAYHQLGYVQAQRSDPAAFESLQTAYDLAVRDIAAHPQDPTAGARLARNEIDYADRLLRTGHIAEGLTHAQAARQRFESLVAADPLNSRKRQNLALAFSVESHALFANGDGPAALRALERAVNAAETLLAGEPTNQGNQITVMLNHYELGTGLIRVGRTAHGAARLRQAIAEAEAILRVSPRNNFMRSQLAAAKLDLGKALIAADPSSAEGCRQVTEGLEIWARARTRVPEELASQRARFEPIVARCRPR